MRGMIFISISKKQNNTDSTQIDERYQTIVHPLPPCILMFIRVVEL